MAIENSIDARGLNCPLPVLKAQKRLKSMPSGARLEILADDPKAPDDFRHFVDETGHKIEELSQTGQLLRVVIVKS